jgi:hypothetical protein
MGGFLGAAFGFPAVLFTFLLIVILVYWALVSTGVLSLDTEGGDADAGEGADGMLDRLGLSGVPLMVILSAVIAIAWFVSLVGTSLLNGAGVATPIRVVIGLGVLLTAVVFAFVGAWGLSRPLRRLFDSGPAVSRRAFVGRECVIRTGQVSGDFGQAEVTAEDGSSALVQVRQTGQDTFTAGSRAVIYDYDEGGEFFWVVPVDAANPGLPTH